MDKISNWKDRLTGDKKKYIYRVKLSPYCCPLPFDSVQKHLNLRQLYTYYIYIYNSLTENAAFYAVAYRLLNFSYVKKKKKDILKAASGLCAVVNTAAVIVFHDYRATDKQFPDGLPILYSYSGPTGLVRWASGILTIRPETSLSLSIFVFFFFVGFSNQFHNIVIESAVPVR